MLQQILLFVYEASITWKFHSYLLKFVRPETLMSGMTTMSFDGEELGERSITTQDIIVSDVSVIQFDVC